MTQPYITAREVARRLQELTAGDAPDMDRFVRESVAPVQSLLERHDLLTLGVERQAFHADNSQWLYYDNDFHIHLSPYMRQGTTIPPHDHGVWELVGIYRGSVDHVLYRRTDDRSVPGRMSLEVIDHQTLKEGDVVAAIPPGADIHTFTTLQPETYMLAVTGGHFNAIRTYFLPDEGKYYQMPILARRRSLGQ